LAVLVPDIARQGSRLIFYSSLKKQIIFVSDFDRLNRKLAFFFTKVRGSKN
jgi:hypothetical protein